MYDLSNAGMCCKFLKRGCVIHFPNLFDKTIFSSERIGWPYNLLLNWDTFECMSVNICTRSSADWPYFSFWELFVHESPWGQGCSSHALGSYTSSRLTVACTPLFMAPASVLSSNQAAPSTDYFLLTMCSGPILMLYWGVCQNSASLIHLIEMYWGIYLQCCLLA